MSLGIRSVMWLHIYPVLIGVCTVHSAEWDCYWCVYSAQCRVRLLLVCVQCTVQSETVIGVCTVHSEIVIGVCTVHSSEWGCYWCVYGAQCRVRHSALYTQQWGLDKYAATWPIWFITTFSTNYFSNYIFRKAQQSAAWWWLLNWNM
jgi:hypothetical protein